MKLYEKLALEWNKLNYGKDATNIARRERNAYVEGFKVARSMAGDVAHLRKLPPEIMKEMDAVGDEEVS